MNKAFFLFACLMAVPFAATAVPETLVVCYVGGPINANDANAAIGAMLRVVERVGHWQEGSFTSVFAAKTGDCRKQIAEKKPKFAIISLGLYLEQRTEHNLVPLVQPEIKGQTSEHYRVIVKKEKFKNLDELRGKTLGGTVLEEQEFVEKIVFAGKYALENFFTLKPTNQAIRALRLLDKGELDAVILNEQQYGALAALKLENPIEVVFTSEEIPLMGVVADIVHTTAEERSRFGKALAGMCADSEGKKLCDLFGVEAFAVVDGAVFEPMMKLWERK